MSVQVFTNGNICPIIASFLTTYEQRGCARTNKALAISCYKESYKRIAPRIPQKMIQELGVEHFRHARILCSPHNVLMEPFGEFSVPIRPCRENPLTIGIGKKKGQLFIGVRVNTVAQGRLCGSLVVKSEIHFLSCQFDNPGRLMKMRDFLNGEASREYACKNEEPRRCCFSTRLFSLLRRCLFKTKETSVQLA